jgi:hypothetical protein
VPYKTLRSWWLKTNSVGKTQGWYIRMWKFSAMLRRVHWQLRYAVSTGSYVRTHISKPIYKNDELKRFEYVSFIDTAVRSSHLNLILCRTNRQKPRLLHEITKCLDFPAFAKTVRFEPNVINSEVINLCSVSDDMILTYCNQILNFLDPTC